MENAASKTAASVIKSVLVVEDEPVTLMYLSDTLQELGFNVTQANNATEAIHAASDCPGLSVAFVDLGLPDLSGLELISELRKMQPGLNIVIASGYGEMAKRDLDNAEDTDNFTVLTKPYNQETITEILSDLGVLGNN
ncbi:MAG TPA: response regulator [Steroidobacteraceae bacterium]|jgi:CheY-like chemotaxis protein|nr:response regulator [Steroidobacteraceae bacterium]